MDPLPAPRRILIVRLSHLGDVCHALPLYHALRKAYPDAELGWAIQPAFQDLVSSLPGMGPLFLFDRRGGFSPWTRLRKELRHWQPDWAIDAQGNWKSAWVTRLSGAPRRVGFHKRDWQEPLAAWAMTERAQQTTGKHCIERVQQLVQHILPGDMPAPFHLPLTEAAREQGRQVLDERLSDQGRPRRLIHPGCPGDPRSLHPAALEELARTLTAAGEEILLITGPGEADTGRELARRLSSVKGVHHWISQRGVLEVAALFAAAGAQGIRLVTGDSGPAHLAAAVNMGVDQWVGPTDPEATGPWPLVTAPHTIHTAHRSPSGNISDLRGETFAQALLQPEPRP